MTTLDAGVAVLAGAAPLCRPATVYRLRTAGAALVTAEVAYSSGSPAMVGRVVSWPRVQFEAAWRLGDVRVVPAWSAPTETLGEALARRTGRATQRRADRLGEEGGAS